MDYHHTCLVVSDTEASLALYRDVMDFRIVVDTTIPEGDSGGYFDQRTLDDIFDVDGANSRLVLLASRTGALLELEEPRVPAVQKTPREQLRYGYTGISEMPGSRRFAPLATRPRRTTCGASPDGRVPFSSSTPTDT